MLFSFVLEIPPLQLIIVNTSTRLTKNHWIPYGVLSLGFLLQATTPIPIVVFEPTPQ